MENLIYNQKSLSISTIDNYGEPCISYSTFVYKDKKIYIYISQIAQHYKNLLENPNVSVMIIEDENKAKTVFDRTRLYLKCKAKILTDNNEDIYELFDKNHGAKMMKILKNMDFDIFELEINSGRYIEGFSRVYDLILSHKDIKLKKVDNEKHNK